MIFPSLLSKTIISLLFPNTCLCCGEFCDIPLCKQCLRCLPRKKKWHCPHCQEKTTPLGALCSGCFGRSPIDGIFSAVPYRHPTVSRVITAYKYSLVTDLSRPIGDLLLDTLLKSDLPLPDIILPVPLHPRRLRWRGFNQSALLAQYLSGALLSHITIPVSHNLARFRYTIPQAKTDSRNSRQKNLKNAFAFNGDSALIHGKRVWLIDDVATTGMTLSECARVLKKNGAKEIWGIVVAS